MTTGTRKCPITGDWLSAGVTQTVHPEGLATPNKGAVIDSVVVVPVRPRGPGVVMAGDGGDHFPANSGIKQVGYAELYGETGQQQQGSAAQAQTPTCG